MTDGGLNRFIAFEFLMQKGDVSMYEASKALMRRLHDNRFVTRYLVGNGPG